MMKKLSIVAMVVAVAACGGKKAQERGRDWSSRPLDVTITDKVNNIGFTIKVPKGMRMEEASDKGPEAITKSWQADLDDHWNEPSFAVSYDAIPAKTLDDYVAQAILDSDDVVGKKEAFADGFMYVTHTKDKGLVGVHVLKKRGDAGLECRASQAGEDGPVKNADKTIAWLEQLCRTLAFQ